MSDMTNLAGDKMSTEFDRMDEDGDAERAEAEVNIARVMKQDGMSLEVATRLYGVPEPRT